MESSIGHLQRLVELPAGAIHRASGPDPLPPYWLSADELPREQVRSLWREIIGHAPATGLWPVAFNDDGADLDEMLYVPVRRSDDPSVLSLLDAMRRRLPDDHYPSIPDPIDALSKPGFAHLPFQPELFGSPLFSLVLVPGRSAADVAARIACASFQPAIGANWVQRFDGAVLWIQSRFMSIAVRRRPASIQQAAILVREMAIAGVRNDDAESPEDYLQLTQWNLNWD